MPPVKRSRSDASGHLRPAVKRPLAEVPPPVKSPLSQTPPPVKRPLSVTDGGNSTLMVLISQKLVT